MQNRKKNYNNVYKNKYNYYNNSSTAHDYSEDVYYKQNKINRRIRKKKKDVYVNVEQDTKILSFKSIFAFAFIIGFIILAVFMDATIIQKKFEIEEINSKIKEVNENNKNLETELAKNLDLKYVEAVAVSRLDMQKPALHQIIHIKIPKESYSEKGNIEKKEESFFEKLKKYFTS